jgi:predicted metal-dependent phosphoesterase TrpH
MCTIPVLKRFCRESYNDPLALYETLKRRGMQIVTVTDHDSVGAAEVLRRFPDFFVSEEVTCILPGGTEAHIAVYDITERQHIDIQARRNDMPRLLAYLREQDLLFGVNHAFSALTGRRCAADFALFEAEFPVLETRNGAIPARSNRAAARMAARGGKIATGGSDSHTMGPLARTWTEVHGARNVREFLDGLRAGRATVAGADGTPWLLTRTVLETGGYFVRELGWPAFLFPLFAAVPFSTAGAHLWDILFASLWGRRLEQAALAPSREQLSVPA